VWCAETNVKLFLVQIMLSVSSDDADSGMESITTQESKENSPKKREVPEEIEEDEEDVDETLGERLWGLTEMFPESVRSGVYTLTTGCLSSVKNLYSFSRSAAWVLFASSTILIAPVVFEVERAQVDEMQKQQQRQILLGPNAAVSGGMNPMGQMGMLRPGPPPS